MGMILMIMGVLCFTVGYVLYSSSKKTPETGKQASNNNNTARTSVASTDTNSSTTPSRASQGTFSANELEKIVSMAIADGVLTPNERNLIKDFANSRGLNYSVIIHDVEKKIAKSGGLAETEIVDVNKRQGDDFEKFIVQRFDKKYFKIKEWAGDKYVNGTYAETTQNPDLLLELRTRSETAQLAVECKWRNNFYKNGILFATPDQFKRYQGFEKQRNIPVFIAIGVGGSGAKPEQLFIVPLRKIKSNFISSSVLQRYQKKLTTDFYYDVQAEALR